MDRGYYKMVKILIILMLFVSYLSSIDIGKKCIACHRKQKIPSELIYRRYLTKYSTHKTIRKIIFEYLKNPKKENSVMPKQFFLKFPAKKRLDMNDSLLIEAIDCYLDHLDIKKKLVLP